MVINDQHIELIVDTVETDLPGLLSVYFNRPMNFTFKAGDWIDIQFKGHDLKGGITYSISSSPTESRIRISFREGVSEIKRALQNVKRGDTLFISQYGNDYDFELKKSRSSILIAGGIGIAPFRSMLKEMYDNGDNNEVTLIYLNQNENFLFKKELEIWSEKLTNVTLFFICTKEINRKKRERILLSLIKNTNQNFYISGPPAMVEANEHLLIDHGVAVRDIRIDSFGGY